MRSVCWLVGAMMVLVGSVAGTRCTGDATKAVVIVTEADFGKIIRVNVGDEIGILLQENPSTGFQWRCRWAAREQLVLVSNTFVPGNPQRPGQGGVRCFLLRAKARGFTDVTLQYGRWWPGGERQPPEGFVVRAY